ncbi:MAG: peptide chain release factor N(5)-glutamine methyltransferase [Myxococcales bacterium]|nr:peptide chain release factor N(5)-glutamine methyltransferase [Polyangiaceae bacterium]MDW8249348.1 peptide chain release factor N(5)-glutamine methyltransferase [Myxococcales bacterium]
MSAELWTVGRVIRWATDDFKSRGIESPRLDAELLLGQVLGIDRIRIITDAQRPLTSEELGRMRELIRRRRTHEPIAYLLGRREFYGHTFLVNHHVLIPRPDTETLVEVALIRTRHRSLYGRMLDLCTGSGCVAISFSRERPNWHIWGTDISSVALVVARQNALQLGAIWNVSWREGDLFEPLPSGARFELITANPPYIPDTEIPSLDPTIRNFEPQIALCGGPDGLMITRRIVEQAPRFLSPGGVLALEILTDTGSMVAELFSQQGFREVQVTRDYGGRERVVSGLLLLLERNQGSPRSIGNFMKIQPAEALRRTTPSLLPNQLLLGSPSSLSGPEPFARVLGCIGRRIDEGEKALDRAAAIPTSSMDPGELLALQAQVYRYTEAVDLATKLVERTTSAVKTTLQSQ